MTCLDALQLCYQRSLAGLSRLAQILQASTQWAIKQIDRKCVGAFLSGTVLVVIAVLDFMKDNDVIVIVDDDGGVIEPAPTPPDGTTNAPAALEFPDSKLVIADDEGVNWLAIGFLIAGVLLIILALGYFGGKYVRPGQPDSEPVAPSEPTPSDLAES